MKTILADTNILLRFLLADVPAQTKEAQAIFQKAQSGTINVVVDSVSIFETEYILNKYYGFPKAQAIKKLRALLSAGYINIFDRKTLALALEYFDIFSESFADCFLLARAKSESLELWSFDQKLMSTWKKIKDR